MNHFENALRLISLGAFFMGRVFVVLISTGFVLAPSWAADCLPMGSGQLVNVAYVYDGDTVRLKDGRRVRLLGINTPELGRNKAPNQRYSKQAKKAVEQFLSVKGEVFIYGDNELQDRYGRHLAHLIKIKSNGEQLNLGKHLLAQGLAYHIVVPPNLELADCFARVETIARNLGRGLWDDTGILVLKGAGAIAKGGYQRIRAQVSHVNLKKAWWINLNDGFVAVIYPENQRYFDRDVVEAWQGVWLELEGWVYQSSYKGKPQWRVKLETAYAVTEVSDD